VLIWMAPSPIEGGDGRRIQIVTPDQFTPIPDQRDPLVMAGVLIDADQGMTGMPHLDVRRTVWVIYDDTVVIALNENGKILSIDPHGLGGIPGVLAHRRKPTRADRGLLDCTSGSDILSAHKAVLFLHLCILRLAKAQGERQPTMSGVLAGIAKNQPLDGESPIALPPGVTMSMLDSKTDPNHIITAIKEFVGGVANTYGLSYEQLTFTDTSDTSSGTAYEVRREKLNELRNTSAKRWRRIEPQIATLLRFPGDEMHVDFHERDIPQDAEAELRVLRDKMKMGLDNPIEWMRRRDPDLDFDAARLQVEANLAINGMMWSLMASRNQPREMDAEDPGGTAEENGSAGGRPSADAPEPDPDSSPDPQSPSGDE
jgi:hypothetical protein